MGGGEVLAEGGGKMEVNEIDQERKRERVTIGRNGIK